MKKVIIILIFLTNSTLKSNAQKYYKLIDTNKIWSVLGGNIFGGCQTIFYKFKGDTSIEVYHYKKLYSSSDSLMSNWYYVNALREDSNGKVYIYYNSKEVLYFNFNLNKKDTFTTLEGIKMIVDSINTLSLLDNEKRKQLFLNGYAVKDRWIEGIGSGYGIIHFGFNEYDVYNELICFNENDTLKYQEPGYNSCYINCVGIQEENYKGNSILIFPDPFHYDLLIKSEIPILNINVFSIDGKNVYSENSIKRNGLTTYNLYLGKLPPSFYIIKITNELNQIFYEKIIKSY